MLSPLDDRLALLSMQVSGPTISTQIQSRPVERGKAIDLGNVPFADNLTITIAASDGAGRLLGYGRAEATVDVGQGTQVEVAVRLRRPFAYLIGGPQVTAIDTTFDITQSYRRDMVGTGATTAVAVPGDGKDIVAVEGKQVKLLDTATHAPVAGSTPLAISAEASDAMVSPDSQWLVIAHATGVSLIKLAELRAGNAQPRFLGVGAASAITFSGGLAWVLIGRAGDTCPGAASSLVAIDLAAGSAGPVVNMGVPIADLAGDAASGTVLVATPCLDAVKLVSNDGGTPTLTDFVNGVPHAGAVVALNGRMWALGSVDAREVQIPGENRTASDGTAHLVLVSKDLGTSGGPDSMIALPVPEELAQTIDLGLADVPGQSAEVRMGADRVRPLDLAVLPDGSRLAVLWNGSYDTVFFGTTPIIGGPLVASLTLTTSEYQLLDVATGAPLQRLRTRCTGEVLTNDGFLKNFTCVQSPGQDIVPGPGYAPAHVAVLFGDR